jgi:hypothetical protein
VAPSARLRLTLRWTTLLAAVVLLNASLTFHNVWPTPAVRWTGDLSIELGLAIFALAVAGSWSSGTRGPRAATALWMVLALGRYVDVTAPALFGREINLYWDLRFLPDVAAMFLRAEPILIAVMAAAVLMLGALYAAFRWAIGRLVDAAGTATERRALACAAVAAVVLFGVQRLSPEWPGPSFAKPVLQSYARQASLAIAAMSATRSLPPAVEIDSDLSLVAGADVLLTFMESYGAVTYQRPEFAAALAGSRMELEAAIRARGHQVVSAYVESPTFGGSSWFAHLSLLSGVEVRDPGTNALLMAQERETLVTAFRRRGYRTVAFMPGLWQLWPEGGFYGFDDIYDGERLGYRGPEFGWWSIPDQFTFAKLQHLELSEGDRAPAFVFFPTISTHTPFTPTPPYQEEWRRVLSAQPFDSAEVEEAFNAQPDWTNLSPSYVEAVRYGYSTIAGFLSAQAGRDFVMVLLGDHQPPALVTGEGAAWDVPVHVIASRDRVLARLRERGFRAGLTPQGPAVARMHVLLQMLLEAFGDPERRVAMSRSTETIEPAADLHETGGR